jgi:hypothetical protein
MDPHVEDLPATTTEATEDVTVTREEGEEATKVIDMMDVAATMEETATTATNVHATTTVMPQAAEVTTAETIIIMTLVVKKLAFY